jgi:hypothetical protein
VQLNGRVSKTTDAQLANAVSAGTYDSTYKSVMQSLLQTYSKDIQIALNHSPGPKGTALMKADLNDSKLLLVQLGN